MKTMVEHRAFDLEIREASNDDNGMVLRGYAAVFDQPTSIGGYFREVIKPGAFTKTLAESKGIKALRNHNTDIVLASVSGGTLTLSEDGSGLLSEMRLDPENSDHRNTYLAVKRGDVDKMSFAFSPVKEAWVTDDQDPNNDLRELLEVKLYEVSPVAFPAYAGTSVEAEARAILTARGEAGADPSSATTSLHEETTDEPDSTEHHSAAEPVNKRLMRMRLVLQEKECSL